jgi:surface-adhesin protein E
LVCVVLAPVVLVSFAARAAGDWHPVGETQAGHKVSVSSVRVLQNDQRTAWVRVEYKEPTKLPQGGPFVEMRSRVRFNCANRSSAPTAVWFYSRDHGGKIVVSKKAAHDYQFGQDSEGGFEAMARDYVCNQK